MQLKHARSNACNRGCHSLYLCIRLWSLKRYQRLKRQILHIHCGHRRGACGLLGSWRLQLLKLGKCILLIALYRTRYIAGARMVCDDEQTPVILLHTTQVDAVRESCGVRITYGM